MDRRATDHVDDAALEPPRDDDWFDDDSEREVGEQLEGLSCGEWAFIWACATVSLVAMLALAGWVWDRWLRDLLLGWVLS